MIRYFTLLIVITTLIGEAQAQRIISGVIRYKTNHEPIAGATVSIEDKNAHIIRSQSTHANGAFKIFHADSAVSLSINAYGCEFTRIGVTDTNYYSIELTVTSKRADDIVVTAERYVTAVQDVPVSIAVVKEQELLSRAPTAIDDALRWVPGVTVTESQVNIRGSSGYGRGVGSRVLFLLDGMPLLAADNGDIKFDILPAMDISRIEVVKGAGSALYGSSALGGVINLITREPTDTMRTAFTAFGGIYDQPKYDQWRVPVLKRRFTSLELGSSGMIGRVGILGSAVYRRNEGYRLGDDSYKEEGFLKVTTPLSSHTSLNSSIIVANEDHGGWLYWKNLSNALLPSDSLGALNGRIHSFKANLQSSLNISTESLAHIIRGDVYFTHFSTDPTAPGAPEGAHSNGTNYTLEYDLHFDASDHLFLTSGLIGNYQTVSSDLFSNHHGLSLAYLLQGEWKSDSLTLTAGVRADAIAYDTASWLGNISPKLGASYRLSEDISLRASFGTGFRAPTISEQFIDQVFSGFPVKPNPSLTPERSYSTEIGAAYRDDHWYIDGALFYSRFSQLIEPQFTSNGTTSYIQFKNVTDALIVGHEEVLEYFPFANNTLTARIGYTYVFPQNRITREILEFRPRHLFQSRLSSEIGSLSLSADFRYISKYETVDPVLIQQVPDGESRVDAYVLDARVSYGFDHLIAVPVKLTFQVQNLLNYYYVEIVGNVAPLRNFSLRVETVF